MSLIGTPVWTANNIASGIQAGDRSWATLPGAIALCGQQLYRLALGGKISEDIAQSVYAKVQDTHSQSDAIKATVSGVSKYVDEKDMKGWAQAALKSINSAESYDAIFDDLTWFVVETAKDTQKAGETSAKALPYVVALALALFVAVKRG